MHFAHIQLSFAYSILIFVVYSQFLSEFLYIFYNSLVLIFYDYI